MKKLAIVLVVLVGLLVAIDFGAAAAAEYQVSKRLRGHLNLPDDPAVQINGFPFLTQAFSGDYRDVDVAADRVTVARLRDLDVEATLHHVRVPFSELVSGNANSVKVDEVVGRVRIQVTELRKLIDVPDLTVDQVGSRDTNAAGEPLPKDAIKLNGTAQVLGQNVKVTVIGTVGLVNGQVQVTPLTVKADGQTLPAAIEQSVLRLFTMRIDPGALPFSVTPTAVHADNGTLVVEGTARDVVLNASTTG